jgi:3-oxoacyl-(acyl-carrier-protein) synthase
MSPVVRILGAGVVLPPFDAMKDLPDGIGRRMGRQPAMALAAILSATRDRGDLRDAALVLGTAHGAMGETIEFISGAAKFGARGASPLQFAGSLHNAMAGAASRALGVRGPSLVISNGETSFEAALGVAVRMLRLGRVPRAVVGGSDAWHPVYGKALARLGLPSSPGEGAGAVLLEMGEAVGSPLPMPAVPAGSFGSASAVAFAAAALRGGPWYLPG